MKHTYSRAYTILHMSIMTSKSILPFRFEWDYPVGEWTQNLDVEAFTVIVDISIIDTYQMYV